MKKENIVTSIDPTFKDGADRELDIDRVDISLNLELLAQLEVQLFSQCLANCGRSTI